MQEITTGDTPTLLSQYLTASNRIGAFSYDQRGNVTAVPGRPTTTYDAENHQISSVNVNGTSSYAYDGDGRRVSKTVGSVTTTFVYDAMGALAAEYGGTVTPVGRQYVTVDHLGSTRVITGGSGTTTYDYLPFGEELGVACLNAADGVKFTSYRRDQESCLDFAEARYMSPAQGRFTSPDETLVDQSADDPQSWNLFGYVRNNPLNFTDPSGQKCTKQTLGDEEICPGESITVTDEGGRGPIEEWLIDRSIRLIYQTYRLEQQVSSVLRPVVDYATRPRNPLCMASYTAAGSSIGFWAGGGLGTLGLAGGPAAAATIPGGRCWRGSNWRRHRMGCRLRHVFQWNRPEWG